jgi:small subunit ribosomal protein S19e
MHQRHMQCIFLPAAAICRRLYNRPGIGVGRFQTLFGGRERRGTRPEVFSKSAGEQAA